MTVKIGDKVEILDGSIDKNEYKGLVGQVSGFARLSIYHAQEAMVSIIDGDGVKQSAWFWVRDLKTV